VDKNKKIINILENNVVEVLIDIFHKDEEVAKKLVEDAKLGDFIAKHPIALHDAPYHFAVEILTGVKDYESIEKYC